MRENRNGETFNVVRNGVIATVEEGGRPNRLREREGRSGARADQNVGRAPRRVDDVEEIIDDFRRDLHVANGGLNRENFVERKNRFERIERGRFAIGVQDGAFGGAVGIADRKAHQEAVELAFGERVRSFELDRVFGRDDEEGARERTRRSVGGNLAFARRFEGRALRSRRRAVDFVGEDDVRENRARDELEILRLRAVNVGADDVERDEVGSELNSGKSRVQTARERLAEKRFTDAGNVFEKKVSFGEKGDEGLTIRFRFSDKGAFDVFRQPLNCRRDFPSVHKSFSCLKKLSAF